MRQLLGVALLGATLAYSTSAAFAYGDTVDYVPPFQRTHSEPAVSRAAVLPDSGESVVAGGGGTTATSVYRHLREENREGPR